jgi:hypothetical protein
VFCGKDDFGFFLGRRFNFEESCVEGEREVVN